MADIQKSGTSTIRCAAFWGIPALQMPFKSNYGYVRGNSAGERSGLRLVLTDVAKGINRSGLTTFQVIMAFPTPLENKNQPCTTKSEDKSWVG